MGGIDIDQIVLAHVAEALDGALERLDPDAPTTLALLARLRQDCVDAKEQLSSDTEATIPVTLPDLQTEVRLTRAELERKIAPPLHDTIRALRRALASAAVEPSELRAVLLVGGASRMPIVADLVSQELGRPVALDAHPKHSVAIGAALAARGTPVATVPRASMAAPVPVIAALAGSMAAPNPPTPASPPPLSASTAFGAPAASSTDGPADSHRSHSKALVGAIGGLAVAVLVLAGVFVLRGGAEEAAAFPIQNPGGATAPTGVVGCPQGTAAVCISDLRIDGGQVAAEFTSNVGLSDPVDGAFPSGTVHPLFFWDTQGPARGRHWGSGSPFTGTTNAGFEGFTSAEVPTGATLCVVLIDNDGTWVPDTGNCVSLG